MSSVPCQRDDKLRKLIREFAETLKTDSHSLGAHGLSEKDFYQGGLFRGAIERVRGQFSASMREKRDFVSRVLNWMQDGGHIKEWDSAGGVNRHDYTVRLNNGKLSGIELKGCLDGNNTNIFERPPHVHEFVIWSICSNPGADPRHNVWSGIHTRLSAEIISRSQQVDGMIVWDWICGTVGRPCPKVSTGGDSLTTIGLFELPPPCIYLFPATIPSPRNNPKPAPHQLANVGLLAAFHTAFGGNSDWINEVEFEVGYQGTETVRSTTIKRGGVTVLQTGRPTPIQRS